LKDHYVFPAIVSSSNPGYSVTFPDLPGCVSGSDTTAEEALQAAKEGLSLHLWGMEDDGDPIPDPSPIESIALETGEAIALIDVWMVPIRDEMANRSVNKTLTLPRWLDKAAAAADVNYSQVLQATLKAQLGIQ